MMLFLVLLLFLVSVKEVQVSVSLYYHSPSCLGHSVVEGTLLFLKSPTFHASELSALLRDF